MNDFVGMFTKMIPAIREDELELIKKGKLKGQSRKIQCEREVPISIYKAKTDVAPVLFELHGGGFVFGSELKNHALCEYISKKMDINVVSIGYSKAPENPYPAALEDVYSVIKYFYDNSEAEKVDKNAFAVMGFSAGANLAAASSILNGKRKGYTLCGQVLHYPYLDAVTPADKKPRHPSDIPLEMIQMFVEVYCGVDERVLATVSPIMAKKGDVLETAPTLIVTAENDSLRDEGLIYSKILNSAGVETTYRSVPNAHHGYVEDWFNPNIYAFMPEDKKNTHDENFGRSAQDAIDSTIEFLKKVWI